MQMRRPSNISDLTVPQVLQVLERFGDAVLVIEQDIADQLVHAAQVEIDRSDAMFGQHIDHAGVDLRSQNRHRRHLQSDQPLHRIERALRVVIGIQHQRFHVVQQRLVLKCGGDVREKGIADIRNDQPEQRAAAHGKVARGLILRVAQLLNRRQNALPRLRSGSARSVEHVRNRGDGNARPAGYIFDAYAQRICSVPTL